MTVALAPSNAISDNTRPPFSKRIRLLPSVPESVASSNEINLSPEIVAVGKVV